MSIRIRKLAGVGILLAGLAVYTLAAVALADLLSGFLAGSVVLEMLYFIAAGIIWAFPARVLIAWMQRP